jgi:hypothetical protein
MAKKKTKQQQPKRKVRARPAVPRGLGLTADERTYAALVADPCRGPLVSGPFGDGSGGFVTRFEKDFLLDATATSVASALVFVPGEPNTYFTTTPITDPAASITWANNTNLAPGSSYLLTSSTQFRCIAACLQVYWPGSELNRQGIVSVAQLPADIVQDGVCSVDEIRSASPYVERMPEGCVEIKWRPTEYDTMWGQVQVESESAGSGAFTGKKSALVASIAGLPVSTGVRYRIVAVYEWKPRTSAGLGLMVPDGHSQVKTGTLNNVIRFLDSTGDWMYEGAHKAGMAISKFASGVGAIASLTNGVGRLGRIMLG